MGFRFRKSFGKGPLRATISKSGVGYSVGTKGFRYTKKAGGGTRVTTSIPGTGISWVSESSSKDQKAVSGLESGSNAAVANDKTRCCKFCGEPMQENSQYCYSCDKFQDVSYGPEPIKLPKYWWIWLIVGVLALRGCGKVMGADKLDATDAPVITQIAYEIPEQLSTEAQEPTEVSSWFLDGLGSQSINAISTYMLNTDSMKFNRTNCADVEKMADQNKCTYTGMRDYLVGNGYTPCEHCNP